MTAEKDIFVLMKHLAPDGEAEPMTYREKAFARYIDSRCRYMDRQTVIQVLHDRDDCA